MGKNRKEMKRRPYLILTASLVLALMMSACRTDTDDPTDNTPPLMNDPPTNVAVYLRTWPIPQAAREGGPYWKAGMIKGEYLSDIIIAFALIDKTDGYSLYIPEVRSGSFAIWNEVASLKEKYPHLKVHISVGGYGEGGFSDMANDPVLRAAFVADVCDWLETRDLDGIDIDWEYPVGPSWGQEIKSRPEDRQNYISLLQDLRDALDTLGEETGKQHCLSSAVPASSWFVTRNDVRAAAEIVDRLKIMAYDYYGDWSNRTGHYANLYTNSRESNGWSTDSAVRAYLKAGVAPEKIMLGVGFYGYVWKNVAQGNYPATPGLFQSGTSDGSLSWTAIKAYLKSGSGYKRYWDSAATAPFLYNGSRWVSYTDHEQIRALANYVKEKNLGGAFVWEYGHDMGAELLQTLAMNSP